MLNLSSVMIGSVDPEKLARFWEKVLEKEVDWEDGGWYGWQTWGVQLTIGEHSEVGSKAKEPQRVIFNLETEKVREEFERIKKLGAKVVKEPYEMHGMWIATLEDVDGNYFQLVTPWEGGEDK